jgi:hypothetical protein
MKRIRMKQTLATGYGIFVIGESYLVPDQVPEKAAKSWIGTGHAEEDKAVDGAPETKEKKPRAKKEK